jgi:gamma-glutamyl:cysteine ligase YbdK (ATP-grasp superfamily)
LQSTHLNLPFADDREFWRLHSAIRIVLPLIPALAASSPFQDGGAGAAVDGRLAAYRHNARRIPSVAGRVIPEVGTSREQYEREILQRIYADLAPHDPEGVLRHVWVTARGAIARFDRGAIEVRVIDTQECPTADLAVVAAVAGLIRSLTEGRLSDRDLAADPSTETLAGLLDRAIVHADQTLVREADICRALRLPRADMQLGEVWAHLLDQDPVDDAAGEWTAALETILREGPLGRRMLKLAGADPGRSDLRRVAQALCECLRGNQPLVPAER